MTTYEKTYVARWADMDPNGHMRHSAYTDYAAQLRLEYLADHGFPLVRFAQLGIGPILFREETRFLKEVGIGEAIRVVGELGGLSADAARWSIVHTLYKADGRSSAVVTVDGAWLDLRTRKLVVPPADIVEVLRALPRHAGYADIVRPGKE